MPTPLIGTVTLAVASNVPVASTTLTVAVNGGAPAPLPTTAPITFPIGEGETYDIEAYSVSAGGVVSPTTRLSGTAQDQATVPSAPGLSVAFAPAPAPSPAPAS